MQKRYFIRGGRWGGWFLSKHVCILILKYLLKMLVCINYTHICVLIIICFQLLYLKKIPNYCRNREQRFIKQNSLIIMKSQLSSFTLSITALGSQSLSKPDNQLKLDDLLSMSKSRGWICRLASDWWTQNEVPWINSDK